VVTGSWEREMQQYSSGQKDEGGKNLRGLSLGTAISNEGSHIATGAVYEKKKRNLDMRGTRRHCFGSKGNKSPLLVGPEGTNAQKKKSAAASNRRRGLVLEGGVGSNSLV